MDTPDAAATAATSRWMGWRLRLLVLAALVGCYGVFQFAQALANAALVDAQWRADAAQGLQLESASTPALQALRGHTLAAIHGRSSVMLNDGALLLSSTRWLLNDTQRARQAALAASVSAALNLAPGASAPVLQFTDGRRVAAPLQTRGYAGLGLTFWTFACLALALYLVTLAVLLAKPNARNALYAVMALCQSGNLLCIAAESAAGLGSDLPFALAAAPWRVAFDLMTAAAIVHSAAINPLRLPGWPALALAAWGTTAALLLAQHNATGHFWWWAQGGVLALGAAAIGLLAWSHRLEPHASALVLKQFGGLSVAGWAALTFGLALAPPDWQLRLAASATAIWYVFLASLLLLAPFLTRSQQLLREFSLLALTTTLATALDIVFAAFFSLGQFASLTLALFLALGAYAGLRQWVLTRIIGSRALTTERMFEQLYRTAREVELRPDQSPTLLIELLQAVFEPIEAGLLARSTPAAEVAQDGSSLVLPLPRLHSQADIGPQSIRLRHAQRGRRLFTGDDARLADRIVEQLRRAVAYDRAVEQGRSEERSRLAQDLHDDIGARLLTMMYKAPSTEMEDYVRHTLQDLKTLTRGLADSDHRLSHAAGEWKADLSQRLTAAHVTLLWNFEHDEDMLLNVVQWSALTRVLRELISNVMAHARAEHVTVTLRLREGTLTLEVTDDGVGDAPQGWAYGLGLGGVRKRVRQLGGEVQWLPADPKGVRCVVTLPGFGGVH